MLSLVLVLIIWTWGLTPLWVNIVSTTLLVIRFVWRLMLTLSKFFEQAKDIAYKPEEEYYYKKKE